MKNEIANVNWIGKWGAILSFIIGTLFLVMYFIFKEESIWEPAFLFVIMAAILNSIILIILIAHLFWDPKNRQSYVKTIGIILANIPIVILYLFFVFNF